jgi:hypothetical protein
VGFETALWGFMLWVDRDAALRVCKTTVVIAREVISTIKIEVWNISLSSFRGGIVTH